MHLLGAKILLADLKKNEKIELIFILKHKQIYCGVK